MAATWHQQELKVFVGADECINDLQCGGGIDIPVEFADDQQKLALKFMGIGDIGLLFIVGADWPTHPLFIPPDFVHAVVVAAAIRNRRFVEITVSQESSQ